MTSMGPHRLHKSSCKYACSETSSCRRRWGCLSLAYVVLLAALSFDARHHAFAAVSIASPQAAIDTLRRAVSLQPRAERPSEAEVLSAALAAQKHKNKLNTAASFYEKLTGGGRDGGQRWRLVYLATRNAIVAARKGQVPPSPIDRGWYVDGIVTAVQRFEDGQKRINQNGVFELLGIGGFFFGYFARFKWPASTKRTTMAFQPITNNLQIFGKDWSWPFAGSKPGLEGDSEFESARLQDLNIFNFFYVDEHVAVAQGASGSVALWGATEPEWEAEHLSEVEPP